MSVVWGVSKQSHIGADGSSVGVEMQRTASLGVLQQGAAGGGQRHRQCQVVIVRGHVRDAFATIVHVISGADVKG